MSEIDDSFRTHPLAMALRSKDEPTPYATCPVDGEPLISTFEKPGAEFVCMVCDRYFGFLAPVAAKPTPALDARYAELQAAFDLARNRNTP